jgi:hypothetical protein
MATWYRLFCQSGNTVVFLGASVGVDSTTAGAFATGICSAGAGAFVTGVCYSGFFFFSVIIEEVGVLCGKSLKRLHPVGDQLALSLSIELVSQPLS